MERSSNRASRPLGTTSGEPQDRLPPPLRGKVRVGGDYKQDSPLPPAECLRGTPLPSLEGRGRLVLKWLDVAALSGIALSFALLLQPWWPAMFRVGFFATAAFTVLHIVTSHINRPGAR